MRDDLRAYVVQHGRNGVSPDLGAPDAVLVVDETGFLKKGTKSAGVQRQYTATAGRIENSQVGVFLGYASRHGRVLIDRALYLPEDWSKDEARREEARIPGEVAFTTKPKLALAMLERARAAGTPFSWITADSVYGADSALARWAEAHRRGYVLAVTSGQRLSLRPVTAWIEGLPEGAWHRLSAGDGAKGPRPYDWARVPYRGGAEGFDCALLVRRSIAEPGGTTLYLTHAPEGATLSELVRVAGARWTIESLFEQAKGEVGLDQYEVRSWIGWHRHITPSMFALAHLATVRKDRVAIPRREGERSSPWAVVGGSGPGEPGGGSIAAHRARSATPAGRLRRPTATQTRSGPALVQVAPKAPAARQTRALAPADTRALG